MDAPSPGRPFPPLLFWALLVPSVLFVYGGIEAVRVPRSLNAVAVAAFVIPMGMELVAVPIAIILLMRGGYRTRRNVILTLVAAIPALALVGMWLFWNLTHWHI